MPNLSLPALAALAALTAASGGVSESRAKDVAVAIERAVLAHPREAQAVERHGIQVEALMMAVAVKESALRLDVERCEVVGDGGKAFGLWQEHLAPRHRAVFCGPAALAMQADKALRHLAYCADLHGSAEQMVGCYAGRAPDHAKVRERLALARALEVKP